MRKIRLKFGNISLVIIVTALLLLLLGSQFDDGGYAPDRLKQEILSLRAQLRYTELRMLYKQELVNDALLNEASRERAARLAKQDRLSNWSVLRLPTAFETLGHLNTANEVQPRRVVRSPGASNEPSRLVIGIPTVLRANDIYVHDTLNSLLTADASQSLNKRDTLVILAVVPVLNYTAYQFGAETTTSYNDSDTQIDALEAEDRFVAELTTKFAEHIDAGRLELIVVPRSYYPDFSTLRWQLGDGPVRSFWRMKQALDAAYLMMYARFRGVYYLHLEDDVLAKHDFASQIDAFISAQQDDDWFVLEFSRLGFIAKLFRTRDLGFLSQYILLFYPFKPVDWLLEYVLDTMVCSPERDVQHCLSMKSRLRRAHDGGLFQHVGHYSSLDGKVQQLQDASFGKPLLFRGHRNPLAEVSSTIQAYEQFSARAVYEGVNYFWGISPVANDTITIQFLKPHVLSRFYIHSGNAEHPADKCLHAIAEVRYARSSTTLSDYVQVGVFDQFGEARSNASLARAPIGPLAYFRIRITEKHNSWMIINEILIA